ncbi:MAG TPA: RidA family protein [Jatrophihabitantaceae bacterium]|jgi:enamine deaminase RidA (YjgF/YER057c/UK114 family)|nr:RidA family protein [Jatrophihabitantaceae bacterium]
MTISRHNPEELHKTAGYAHVTIVDSGRVATLAGQCPLNRDGELVGSGDLIAQVDQVVMNAKIALLAVGARPDDVIRSVIYVVSDDPGVLGMAWGRLTSSDLAAAFTSASTLVGVAALGYRGQLVEVDLTASLAATAEP